MVGFVDQADDKMVEEDDALATVDSEEDSMFVCLFVC